MIIIARIAIKAEFAGDIVPYSCFKVQICGMVCSYRQAIALRPGIVADIINRQAYANKRIQSFYPYHSTKMVKSRQATAQCPECIRFIAQERAVIPHILLAEVVIEGIIA